MAVTLFSYGRHDFLSMFCLLVNPFLNLVLQAATMQLLAVPFILLVTPPSSPPSSASVFRFETSCPAFLPLSAMVREGPPPLWGASFCGYNLVGTMSSVSAKVGHGVEVVPLCPIPIGGLGGWGLIRDMFDLDSWMHCSTTGSIDPLAETRTVLWETIGETRGVPLVEQPERMLFIPTSVKNPRRRGFRSVGTKNPLPDHLPPLSPENEKRLVFALMDDLNKNFGVGIDPYPSLDRQQTRKTGPGGGFPHDQACHGHGAASCLPGLPGIQTAGTHAN
jgi:hypothetical protein